MTQERMKTTFGQILKIVNSNNIDVVVDADNLINFESRGRWLKKGLLAVKVSKSTK